MKKSIFILLGLLPFLLIGQNRRIYEAENAQITESVIIKNDNTASNDKFLLIKKTGTIKWVVDNNSAGWFKMSLRYRNVGGDNVQTIDVNGKRSGMGFSMCNLWSDAFLNIRLHKGKNEITLIPDWGNMEIDYLSIPDDSLLLLPVISPIKNVFYKDHQATLSIFVDAKGKKLKTIQCKDKKIEFQTNSFSFKEGAYHVVLSKESLMTLPIGTNTFNLIFDDGSIVQYFLQVKETFSHTELTIIMFNVEHGSSTLILLPDGKKMLIDSGKEEYAKSVVMPFLDYNNIDTLDYYLLTHYHGDHIGAKDEILKKYNVQKMLDYKSFVSGDTLKMDKTILTILNAFGDGEDENDKSLSFLLKWNGFTYSHGADNYAQTQNRILKRFADLLPAQVYNANHHFHGSVNPNFIIKTNPSLVVVSAEQGVYARGAYINTYKELTEKYLYAAHARLKETLLTLEAGTVVIRVNDSTDWWFESYRDNKDIHL